MKTVTFDMANRNLLELIENCLSSREGLNIASSKGAVVIIPQDDYESMQETLRLLSDQRSLSALLESHQMRDNNQKIEFWTPDEVFDDI
ncbi:MAG: type II toxin-antitoxin system Phd/YefM family antitoxin [Desulfamplus sp.]|nr:type II toxin-antitoxin system Phd/YefM family antitoxin [Desulfamplus sp.]